MAIAPLSLPLTSYERYFWRNDRPDYPSIFSVWLQLRGGIDEQVLDQALTETIAWHPMLSAVISGEGRGARWTPLRSGAFQVEWHSDSRAPIEPPDITREAGVRVVGSKREGDVELSFHLHHAACDGVGAIEFLGDLFSAYSQLLAGRSSAEPVRELDPQALTGRSFRSASSTRLGRRLTHGAQLSGRFAKALGFRPSTMAADVSKGRRSGADAHALFRLPRLWLDAEEMGSLRDLARRADASLNDLLLVEVLVAVGRWNAEARGGKRLRLLMPTNLRTAEHSGMPAANIVGFEPIDRKVGAAGDWRELLPGIREETAAFKQRRGPSWLDESFAALALRPRLLDALLRSPTPLYTGILSNLGSPADHFWAHLPQQEGKVVVGKAILEGIGFAPPVRPRSPISLGITAYAGKLNITGKADPRTIGAAGLERFLERLGVQLRARAQEGLAQVAPTA